MLNISCPFDKIVKINLSVLPQHFFHGKSKNGEKNLLSNF